MNFRMGKQKAFSLLLLFLFFILGFFYVKSNLKEIINIKIFSYFSLLIIFLLSFILLVSRGFILNYLLKAFDIKLKPWEFIGLSAITSMGNYLTPFRGGAGAKAVYLKKKYGLQYSLFLSTLAATYIIIFSINSLIVVISLWLTFLYYKIFNLPIFITFLVAFLLTIIIFMLNPKILGFKNKVPKYLNNVIDGWYKIRSDYKLIARLLTIQILNAFVWIIIIFFSFYAFGTDLSLIESLLISSLNSISLMISITPASLGLAEAVIVLSAKVFEISSTQSLMAAALIRIINIIVVFSLGPIFAYLLINTSRSADVLREESDYDKNRGK